MYGNLDNDELKIELSKWKKQLKKNLLKNTSKKELYFIISYFWLDKLEKYLSNDNSEEIDLSELYEKYKDTNNELFDSFLKPEINIKELPKIFILNEIMWENVKNDDDNVINTINSIGSVENNMLLLKVLDLIYCFFFLDRKKQIRQGYLQIINQDKENEIINNFKKVGLENFNDDELENFKEDYKIIIFQNFVKNEENRNCQIFDKDNPKQLSELKINNSKSKESENPDEINLKFGSKIYTIPKTININIEKLMGDLKNAVKKIIQINKSIIQPLKEIKKRNENPMENKEENKEGKKIEIENYINISEENKVQLKASPNQVLEEKLLSPGLIGLENIGATCYMNATIQSFSNIIRLRSFLLDKETYQNLEIHKNEKKLSFALAEVLYHLWKELKNDYYKPEYFKEKISEMNPLFKGVAANDPKDLVLFILQTLNDELNNAPNITINNNSANNQNFQEVLTEFFQTFHNENKSIISEEFFGCMNSMTTCGACKITIHNVQGINILFFPLEEVRKFKNYSYNCVKIEDCFDYYEKQEIYPSCFCNKCRQLYPAYHQSKIYYAPRTLIINLNRGRGLQFNVNIDLDEYINLRKYIFYNESPYMYELVAVICHFGSSNMGGHFIAYCKNSNDCLWYKFNDEFVTKISFDEVKKKGVPYVLFYSYVKA